MGQGMSVKQFFSGVVDNTQSLLLLWTLIALDAYGAFRQAGRQQ